MSSYTKGSGRTGRVNSPFDTLENLDRNRFVRSAIDANKILKLMGTELTVVRKNKPAQPSSHWYYTFSDTVHIPEYVPPMWHHLTCIRVSSLIEAAEAYLAARAKAAHMDPASASKPEPTDFLARS